ncbi:MAG: SGNH/GDSL hydrolase family protein [Gammaproteobacteria bacterium]|nr:SGNH/GDSL hydrolase family protein [Gammaproteobacteria bacterium]NNF67800.1 SGNH/GDSL hydrolase family protein [Gammaproteobacteria bacterium]
MNFVARLAAHSSAALAPLLYVQGIITRARIVRLPEASGPRQGSIQGEPNQLRVLLLGESTVAGVGATDHNEGLAGRMAQDLSAMTGATINWQVHAANGLTASSLRSSLKKMSVDMRPDVFIIALGANDVFRLQGPGKWRKDLRSLIDTLRDQFGFAPVMISALPPIGQFPGLPQPLRSVLGLRARLLDHATIELAKKMAGVHFVPLFTTEDPEGLFCSDGIHPSPACYALWARHLAEATLDRLPKRG